MPTGSSQIECARQPPEIVSHQQNVGALQRHIGAGSAHSHAQYRGGQRRRIVHSIADHCDRAVARLQILDRLDLLVWQQFGTHLIHP